MYEGLEESKNYFHKVSLYRILLVLTFLSWWYKHVPFLIVHKRGMFHINFYIYFQKEKKSDPQCLLHLLFFTCLWLKMILVLKWHILEWHILASFITHYPNSDFFLEFFFSPWVWLGTKQSNRLQKHMEIRQTIPNPMGHSLRSLLLVRQRKNKLPRTQVAQHFSSPLACLFYFQNWT